MNIKGEREREGENLEMQEVNKWGVSWEHPKSIKKYPPDWLHPGPALGMAFPLVVVTPNVPHAPISPLPLLSNRGPP